MPELGSSGSVRGALRNERPYRERDSHLDCRAAIDPKPSAAFILLIRFGQWSEKGALEQFA
jgi:hypothetical protein